MEDAVQPSQGQGQQGQQSSQGQQGQQPSPYWKIIVVSSIAAGVQFGWALQLSLLTPYVQQLGVPHVWASFIWLCGPISGLVVQPIVGFFSDHSTNRMGRRRPYIMSGALLVAAAVFLIGFAADIGHSAGDRLDCTMKPRAVGIFVVGFWILDVANNMLQGPCRAFLADLSAGDHKRIAAANIFFAFFMAVGNVAGYGLGTVSGIHRFLPFTKTVACDIYCANLKTLFLIDIILLAAIVTTTLVLVGEVPLMAQRMGWSAFFSQFSGAFRSLTGPIYILYAVTALNWIGWFPFMLYNTDWVGLEIYGGKPQGSPEVKSIYEEGVRMGSLGLLLQSVVLAVAALLGEQMLKHTKISERKWWGVVNLILTVCLGLTFPLTHAAKRFHRLHGSTSPPKRIKDYTLAIFSVMGIPLAVNFSIPFALASIYSSSSGAGQGLSLGLLNLAIVIPQMIVSVVSGKLDQAFGGGNLPAFGMGAISAFISALMALFLLPKPPRRAPVPQMITGGH
ncbi:hypothetical protein SAY87_005543 [Trapa incisa]|uniref:Sucrose transporter n=1 Tax=Trapa incisa TaxID=236973 RepID=A0AAN7K4Y2_9MYRT|nr:hypothetical protein SAY87_005543 [Trapa incisa]